MNAYKSLLAAALVAPLLCSCRDSFLDTDSSQYLTDSKRQELIKDDEMLEKFSNAALLGVHDVLGVPFNPSHDDFGMRACQLATDMMGEDVLMKQSNWFVYDYQMKNNLGNHRRPKFAWGMFYKVISDVNIILRDYYSKESEDPAYKALKAEPIALRGISYFYLVNFFQHTYKGHEKAPGVPVVTVPSEEKFPRHPVEQVYEQIIKDLTFAAEHGAETSAQTDVDRFVAAAYLAKAYAQMENWPMVEKYAAIAKQGGADVVSEPGRSWELGGADILWGRNISSVNSTLYASFYSQVDPLQFGYAGAQGAFKYIHNKLYEKMGPKDSRRKLFLNETDYPDIAAGYKAKRPTLDALAQLKFIGTPAGYTGDYCYLRVQDPMLLEIEAMVEQNKLAEAQAALTDFATKRNPDFKAATTQDALREQVRLERRLELWMEGTNWFDMKRWKLPIIRNVEGTNHFVKTDMNTDDPKYIYKLPQNELNANNKLEDNP